MENVLRRFLLIERRGVTDLGLLMRTGGYFEPEQAKKSQLEKLFEHSLRFHWSD